MIPGRLLPGLRERAWHEAYHAAALLLAGIKVKCVRIDFPTDHEAGSVDFVWRGPDRVKDVLGAVVAGALTEGPCGWDWAIYPPDPFEVAEGAQGDALFARSLVDEFDVDQANWHHVLWKTRRLLKRKDFRRLVVAIAAELERTEVLTAADLDVLMAQQAEAAAA